MSTTDPSKATVRHYQPEDAPPYVEERSGSGWVTFAGTMLALVAALNLIDGIAAVADSRFFVGEATYILGDLNSLGWVLIAVGVTQALTALGVWTRTPGARWVGVTLASLNAIVQMLFIAAYPVWSVMVFALDTLIIYGLVVHGARSERE